MDLASALALRVPGLRVSASPPDLSAAARDLWPRALVDIQGGELPANRPAAVVWPERAEQVSQLVELGRTQGFRVVPFGAGSGVCAGVLPHDKIIVMDLKKMSRWRSLDTHARTLDVEAGQMGLPLEEDLNRRGLTAGHFPSSILCSTVGGWVAARSAGQCSGMYGKIEDMVLALECVTGRGE
ncbi:MAG TPA: FAD-dependent oxidoreductase, partial [Polyangiaceae bacterium]